ncbi:ABC transporter ATP-binding protein [Bacillaceae bacterium]
MAVIELEKLTKYYGTHKAVDSLSLSIDKGEIFGLLGPNGAGKSTTILMMLGLTEPTSGKARVCGFDSTRQPIEVKKRVGYLPDNVGFYEDMTGRENLLYTAALNSIPQKEAEKRIEELLALVGLRHAAEQKAGTYSRGMRQRLGLADVLIKRPEVIILDEPTLGIDPEGVRELLALIHKLSREEGITILLSSHQLHQVQQVCDRVGIFVKGKLLAEGPIDTLARQLFAEDPYEIEVIANPCPDALVEKLRALPQVIDVTREGEKLLLRCGSDPQGTIAAAVIESGSELLHLVCRHHGLDEIYRRYFEGRESA